MSKWTKEEQAQHRKELIKALLSGEYEQGQGELRSAKNTFCCLGIACDLMDSSRWNHDGCGYYWKGEEGTQSLNLAKEVMDYYGFTDPRGALKRGLVPDDREVATGYKFYSYLSELNDNGYSFEFIAGIITANGVEVQ